MSEANLSPQEIKEFILKGNNLSRVSNAKLEKIQDQNSVIFNFEVNENTHQGAVFINIDEEFVLIQIYYRFPGNFIKEKLPIVLNKINSINSISIGGFLTMVNEKNNNFLHHKENMFITDLSSDEKFPIKDITSFININTDMIGAFYEEMYK